jgi:ribonuclease HI
MFSMYICILRHIVQINSKLVWECNQFVIKLAEQNRIQLVWAAGHTGFDGNEIADCLARQRSSHPFTGPESALGISAQVARGDQGLDK